MDWISCKNILVHIAKGEFVSAIHAAFRMQILRYLFSGGTAALVNLATLYVLVEMFSLYYLVASGIAFCVALLVSFVLHKFVTFQDMETQRMHVQVGLYVCLLGFNVLLNLTSMWCLVDGLGVAYLAAQILTSALIAVWSFFAYRSFVFTDIKARAI